MEKITDLNINISGDKVRSGLIFATGFAAGISSAVLFLRKKISDHLEERDRQQKIQLLDMSGQAVERAYHALDRLEEKAAKLHELVNIDVKSNN